MIPGRWKYYIHKNDDGWNVGSTEIGTGNWCGGMVAYGLPSWDDAMDLVQVHLRLDAQQ